MKVSGYEINSMFVQRNETGEICLYGSYLEHNNGPLVVVKSTKNKQEIWQELYGEKFTNEYLTKILKDRPKHNFIGNIGNSPLSMHCDESTVTFVD